MMRALHAARPLAAAGSALAFTALSAAPLPHLDLRVELDPATRRVSGVAQFDAPAELRLRLHRSLAVRSVTLEGVSVPVRPPFASGETQIWTAPLSRRGTVTVSYDGILPPLDPALDHRRVLRVAAPMAAPEGTFLPAGSYWHPRPPMPHSYRLTVTLPAGQRGIAPGDLLEETLPVADAPHHRAVFELRQPAEGVDLMAGPYLVDERIVARPGGVPLRLRTYFPEGLRHLAGPYLDDSARYIALYERWIGDYPYASFSVVASPLPTGLGMPALTYIGADVLKLPFIRATSLGHEVLHNWWGNGVYPDYASGNWSEGLTTFMADYTYREHESEAAAREMRLSWMRDMAAVPREARMPLYQFRSRAHGAQAAVGYGKAAMVFFMLRDLIGADAYDRGIRLFWEQHRFRTASWQDLQRAFETSAGRSLAPFFEQWLRRTDAPMLAVSEALGTGGEGRYQLALTIRQEAPPYALRVPVTILAGGRHAVHWIAVEQIENRTTLDLDGKPEAVQLDPDLRVWRNLQAEELPPILRLWTVARAPEYTVVSPDARVQKAASALARRLFEAEPRRAPQPALGGSDPLLIIGLHADVDALLARLGLPPRPAELAGPATAYAWTVRTTPQGARPVAVVSAADLAALEALHRPLPHYGRQSYLAFDGSRAVTRGVWPVSTPVVRVQWR
jgi:aminopeptidase N